jgi:hypothetical protein
MAPRYGDSSDEGGPSGRGGLVAVPRRYIRTHGTAHLEDPNASSVSGSRRWTWTGSACTG